MAKALRLLIYISSWFYQLTTRCLVLAIFLPIRSITASARASLNLQPLCSRQSRTCTFPDSQMRSGV